VRDENLLCRRHTFLRSLLLIGQAGSVNTGQACTERAIVYTESARDNANTERGGTGTGTA
jgi:hypothetical protein